jgi:hypothetical protein
MEIESLNADDFRGTGGEPKISFTRCGAIIINHIAMRQLQMDKSKKVVIGFDRQNPADFTIGVAESGWEIRIGKHGEGIFNSKNLVKYVIDRIWNRKSHVPGENKPECMGFIISRLPVDDGENKNVFALLRI